MTRHTGRATIGGPNIGPENTPRLRLKPKAPKTGHVDGAWWPHSDDLRNELPDLLAVLSVRLGAVDRVMYNLAEWAQIPRRLWTGGRTVRLDGYRLQPANTLQVLGVGRENILLLVVPPYTDPDIAHDAMMTAAAPNNASTVGDLLATGTDNRQARAVGDRPLLRRKMRKHRDTLAVSTTQRVVRHLPPDNR